MSFSDDFQREVERYLSHFARSGKRPTIVFTHHTQPTPVWTPSVDVYETPSAVVVLLELAGVNARETEIHAEPGQLTVRGVRRERRQGDGGQRTYHAMEIPYGRFERTLPLPNNLATDEARATYRDGLLEITLPRRAPTHVKITVETGEPAGAEESA